MTFEQLELYLTEQGYFKIPSNLPEFTFFFRSERAYVNVFHVVDYKSGLYISEDQYVHLKETIAAFFRANNINEVHILSLLICTDAQKARQLYGQDPFCWIIDPVENRLIVHETQVADFYGMKGMLEDFLYKIAVGTYEKPSVPEKNDPPVKVQFAQLWSTYITFLLVACNVVLFIICTFTGDLVYNIGAFSVLDIIEEGGWYRLISSMFLHADIWHLFSNMVVLYYIGSAVEEKMGHLPYLVLYFLSGLAGNVISAGYELFTMDYVSSIGASGAVFGVEGALIVLVFLHREKIAQITLRRIVFAVAFSLYSGFVSSSINNAAHVGGLLMGFVLAGLMWLFRKEKQKNV